MANKKKQYQIVEIDQTFAFYWNGFGFTLQEVHNVKNKSSVNVHNRYYSTVGSLLKAYVNLKLSKKEDKAIKFKEYIKEYEDASKNIEKIGDKIENEIKKVR